MSQKKYSPVFDSSKLGPDERAEALKKLKDDELDILVVGAGVVGAGSALDAVTRGLSVGLVEARDFGSGTSSRSSKLIHGGVRYLEQLNFSLVREALVERGLLLQQLAPHLVKPIRFLYPLYNRVWERAYVGAGMMVYDVFSYTGFRRPGVGHHKHLTKKQLRKAIPSLKDDALVGGIVYYDAQVDDARYVSTLVRTAAQYGAQVASRVQVDNFLKQGHRVIGVVARDLLTNETFEIRAKQVVNATGVWTDDTQAMVGERGQFKVRASKGIHLVVPRDRFHSTMGLILRTEKSVLFVIPWGRHWIIGTTDTDWHLDKAHPAATATDIDYVLERVNAVLKVSLTREDVEGVYAGLRPLLAGESDDTSKLSREHIVAHSVPGLVVIAGGKFTTYRVMAKDAIDSAVSALDGNFPPSVTEDVPLLGATGYRAAWNNRRRLSAQTGLHVKQIERLLNRYGTVIDDLLAMIKHEPRFAQTLPGTQDYLQAEVVYAATYEGALHVEDVLARRTHMSVESWDRGVSAAPVVAELLADVLGWTSAQKEAEISAYLLRVQAEIDSQQQSDDVSADQVRVAIPELHVMSGQK